MKMLLALLLFCSPALAQWVPKASQGVSIYYSQSYQMSGTCTGGDMVYLWSIDGKKGGSGAPKAGEYGASFIYPWVGAEIVIRGAELVIIPPSPDSQAPAFQFLMLGNNAVGDGMVFVDNKQGSNRHDFPSGMGMPFPSIASKTPLTYLDLHGSCSAGKKALVMVTIYYTMP